MLWKFLKHSTGDPREAVRYLLSKRERNGQLRHGVRILAGSADEFIAVTTNSPHKHKYKSFVMGWADEEAPTIAEIRAEIRRWEQVAFAGLERDQYTYFAVLHESVAGGHDLHILTPRVELRSGRSLNISPPSKAAERAFTLAQDVANAARGWASPSDPTRARLVRPTSPAAFEDAALIRAGLRLGRRPETQITDWLVRGIQAGQIQTRTDVVTSLAGLGPVTREGADYVSVKLPGRERALRLRGLVYERDLAPRRILARLSGPNGLAERGPDWRGGKRDPAAAERCAEELRELVEKRAAYNRARYGGSAVVIELDGDDDSDRGGRAVSGRPGPHEGRSSQRTQQGAPALGGPRSGLDSNDDRHGNAPALLGDRDLVGPGLLEGRPSGSSPRASDRIGAAVPGNAAAEPRRSWGDLVVGEQRSRRGARGTRSGDGPDAPADSRVLRERSGAEELSPRQRRGGAQQRGQMTTELDEYLAQAIRRARQSPASSPQLPKENTVANTTSTSATVTPLAVSPLPKTRPSLREVPALTSKKTATAVASAGVAAGGSAGIELERPPAPGAGASSASTIDVGFFGRVIEWLRNLIKRIFNVVSVEPARAALEQVDPRDKMLAELRAELAATRAELAKLRAAAAARGFDLSNLDQADDAAGRAIDAGVRALELDRARDRARQRREFAAMAAAQQGSSAAIAEVSNAAAGVDRAAADQAQLDSEEASAAEAAREASELDIKDPARAEELRQTWLILDRKIRAAHAQIVDELRHPPSDEPEGPQPTDPDARVKLIQEHRAALKQARLDREDQLASWADERRAIEREMWSEQDLDLDDDGLLEQLR